MRNGRRFRTRCRVLDRDIEFYLGQIVTIEATGEMGVVFSITHFLEGTPSIGMQPVREDQDGNLHLDGEPLWKNQSAFSAHEDEQGRDQFLGYDEETGRCGIYVARWSEPDKADDARKTLAVLHLERRAQAERPTVKVGPA
jgi:hypothetical protein